MSTTATLDPRRVGRVADSFANGSRATLGYQAFLLLAHRLHGRADPLRPRQVLQRPRRLGGLPRPLDQRHRSRQRLTAMHLVGVVEIIAGIVVALKPRYGAYVVAAWLAGIVINLLTYSGYYDIALRDFGLMLAALTLARLASKYDPPGWKVGL